MGFSLNTEINEGEYFIPGDNQQTIYSEFGEKLYSKLFKNNPILQNVLNNKLVLQENGNGNQTQGYHINLVQMVLKDLNGLGDNHQMSLGVYDWETKKQVLAFQKSTYILSQDGKIGARTIEKMDLAMMIRESDQITFPLERERFPDLIKGYQNEELLNNTLSRLKSMTNRAMSNEDTFEVLGLLQEAYLLDYTRFAYLAINMNKDNSLYHLFINLQSQHLGAHDVVVSRLGLFFKLNQISDIARNQSLTFGLDIIRMIILATINEENIPAELLESIESRLANLGLERLRQLSMDELKDMISESTQEILNLTVFEMEYYLIQDDKEAIQTRFREMIILMDTAFELLFGDELTSVSLWGGDGLIIRELDNFGRNRGERIPEIAVHPNYLGSKVMTLKQAFKKLESSPNSNSQTPSGQQSTVTPATIVPSGRREDAKQIIIKEADYFHRFFYSEIISLSKTYPNLLKYLNEEINYRIKPTMATKMPGNMRYFEYKGNDYWDWADLSRFWFYELGPSELGSDKDNILRFGPNAITTNEIKNHISLREIKRYLLLQGQTTSVINDLDASVKYRVPEFWHALLARDKTFNFLGSFKVYATIESMTNSGDTYEYRINFRVYNESSNESGSRFRANKPGLDGKLPIIYNTERTDSDKLQLGGTLRTEWLWSETMRFNYDYRKAGARSRVKFKVKSTDFLNETEKNHFFDDLDNWILPNSKIQVVGYASEEGTKSENKILSKKRAKHIQELIDEKYPGRDIKVKWKGEIPGDREYYRAVEIHYKPS